MWGPMCAPGGAAEKGELRQILLDVPREQHSWKGRLLVLSVGRVRRRWGSKIEGVVFEGLTDVGLTALR